MLTILNSTELQDVTKKDENTSKSLHCRQLERLFYFILSKSVHIQRIVPYFQHRECIQSRSFMHHFCGSKIRKYHRCFSDTWYFIKFKAIRTNLLNFNAPSFPETNVRMPSKPNWGQNFFNNTVRGTSLLPAIRYKHFMTTNSHLLSTKDADKMLETTLMRMQVEPNIKVHSARRRTLEKAGRQPSSPKLCDYNLR